MGNREASLTGILWQIIVNFIASIIIAALLTPALFQDIWKGIACGAVIFVFFSIVIVGANWRLGKLLLSGWAAGCYYTFPLEENKKLWSKYAKRSLKYIGISANTIVNEFQNWLEQQPSKLSLEIYFLLMNPEAKAISKQEAHRLNLPPESSEVTEAAKRTHSDIENSILKLKGLDLYRRGRLKIRVYDEFVPWWIYIFDDRVAQIGILEKGKSGYNSPAMVLKKHDRYGSPFEAFANTWQRMWDAAKDA